MSGLYLNYCFVDLSKNDANIYSCDYTKDTNIRELRNKHPQHYFYRNGNKLYYWSETISSPIDSLNSKEELISPSLEPAIVSKMLEQKLLSLFDRNIYDVYFRKYTHSFVARKKQSTYTEEALSLFESAEISTYFFNENEKIYFGFNVSFRLEHSFAWNKNEFKKNSIDNNGLRENKNGKVCANKVAIKRYIETKGIVNEYNKQIEKLNSKHAQFLFVDKVIKFLSNNLTNKNIYKSIVVE
ncbi:MAG: hypothetical protein EOM55_04925, partial [Clostridia bacterium]|nr:hypothetical protein [Clostridia bacterium]